eukprot:GHRQ01010108.1.p1 GENE.GHRQ01010108.1~~GHRQ01010108.1.p1  ORF type:complete len:185 (+),score=70.17 GHRQ01010108.1:613-1167(+)
MADSNRDLGLTYLYENRQHRSQAGKMAERQQQQRPGSPTLTMAPLPHSNDASRDWGPAQGNLETAKMALDALRSLIMDAVFLDEEAYTNSATLQLYQQRLQAQQRRILQLEGEAEALRVESGRQQDALVQQRSLTRAAEARIQELQQELENNAVVFDMHYSELLVKGEEIERLKSVIEGMGGTG